MQSLLKVIKKKKMSFRIDPGANFQTVVQGNTNGSEGVLQGRAIERGLEMDPVNALQQRA